MVNIMTTKTLKKITELLNRSEGISLTPIIVIMVIMSVMGGVFTSIMGNWKISAPMTINSAKAFNLAETAAMFALQDAKNRFFSKDASSAPDFPASGSGTRSTPFVVSSFVSSAGTEIAEFWIERPYPSINSIDEFPPGTHRGNNDDDISGADDDDVDDDDDDSSHDPDDRRYTIIATGKVKRGGVTVAKRQIKVLADIVPSAASTVAPGVQTDGIINGSGPGFNIFNNANAATVTYDNGDSPPNPPSAGSETVPPIVYRPAQQLDENVFKAMAQTQGHYFIGDCDPANNYPNGSYYFDTPTDTMPNFIYVEGNLALNGNPIVFGVYWVNGTVSTLNGNYQINGIIIAEGDVTLNGSPQNPDLNGGIIQYGAANTINANGNPNIQINNAFFSALSMTIPIVTVQSWQETVSAN